MLVEKLAASPWNGGRKVAADQGGWDSVAPSGIAYHESESTYCIR
jgi:hypothetical protein